MFDNYSISPTNKVNINAVNGTIVKNHKDSFFLRFNLNSELADKLLSRTPRMKINAQGNCKAVTVLQMMLCGNMEVIAEVIWKESEE